MRYRVEIAPRAQTEIKSISRKADQKRVLDAIAALGDDPRPSGCRKLRGSQVLYRIRVGDFRVIYSVHDDIACVLALRVRQRAEVYEKLPLLERSIVSLLEALAEREGTGTAGDPSAE